MTDDYLLAQEVGFEPTASLFLRQSGLPGCLPSRVILDFGFLIWPHSMIAKAGIQNRKSKIKVRQVVLGGLEPPILSL